MLYKHQFKATNKLSYGFYSIDRIANSPNDGKHTPGSAVMLESKLLVLGSSLRDSLEALSDVHSFSKLAKYTYSFAP